jgi:hypothetical protein
MDQAQAVQDAAKNDGPSQQALSNADLAFASKHPRAVVRAMKPRVASQLALAAPVNTVPPVISGTGAVGQTLTIANAGTWAGGGSRAYKWQRDGVDIAGAISIAYVLVAGDSTHSVRAVVVQTNANGTTSANSNAIAVS